MVGVTWMAIILQQSTFQLFLSYIQPATTSRQQSQDMSCSLIDTRDDVQLYILQDAMKALYASRNVLETNAQQRSQYAMATNNF
jgi:hypothetical protein